MLRAYLFKSDTVYKLVAFEIDSNQKWIARIINIIRCFSLFTADTWSS